MATCLTKNTVAEVRASIRAFTPVYDGLWRASKDGGPSSEQHPGRRPPISGLPEIGSQMRKSATADLRWLVQEGEHLRVTGRASHSRLLLL
jgi:hypothetical protein